jgi:hypothetical protein
MYGPMWKSSIETRRSPVLAADDDERLRGAADRGEVLGRVGLAQRAADRAAVAHDGSAMTSSASRNRGKRSASRSDFRRSTWRVIAPILIMPSSSRM